MLDATTEPTGPSEEGLAVNIIQFSHLLRENGISVTLSSVLDAVRGLEFIDISNLELFHGLLQLNFVYRKENLDLFDQLFFLFWFSYFFRVFRVFRGSHFRVPWSRSPSL